MHRKLRFWWFFELPNRALGAEHIARTRKRDGRSFAASEMPLAAVWKSRTKPRGAGKEKGKGRLPGEHPRSSDRGMLARQAKPAGGIGSSEPQPRKDRLRRAIGRNEAGNRFADVDGLRRARAERAVRTRQPCLRTLALVRASRKATAGRPRPPSGGQGAPRRAAGCGRSVVASATLPGDDDFRVDVAATANASAGTVDMAGRRRRFGGVGQQVGEGTAFQFQGTRRPGIRDAARNRERFVRGPDQGAGRGGRQPVAGFAFREGYWWNGVKAGKPAAARRRGWRIGQGCVTYDRAVPSGAACECCGPMSTKLRLRRDRPKGLRGAESNL